MVLETGMLSSVAAELVAWMTLFRIEIFTVGAIIAIVLILNWAYEVIPIPFSGTQPVAAAVILFTISFIWTYTDGGWTLFFDRVSYITLGAALGGLVGPVLKKLEVI
ncbi:hypothetical protein HT576_08730 [Haloterrigena sp. SYSU A121-1]|uniref:Uncharacterized protein n=1 Tax=Haloterrigena gelatinilytica TaxID=2741724 RepID=A0A8J8GME7_9EURY|nr:hypothetical protein [Haloterrigena gelatinilytica]NUB91104.1 hypothetical protein [Haloterrigena gelatinilytica]